MLIINITETTIQINFMFLLMYIFLYLFIEINANNRYIHKYMRHNILIIIIIEHFLIFKLNICIMYVGQ